MARKPLSASDVKAIVHAEIINADGYSSSAVSGERGENMDYYQGQPFGNEIEGRSQVVSMDVMETIEWMLPTLVRIFTSGEDAVEFEPEGPEDVAVAKQATEYVNYIWNRDNSGFLNTYSWFKDALLQKNGILKIWWDDSPKTVRKRYNGLSDQHFATLTNAPDVEVSEHTATPIPSPQGPEDETDYGKTHDLVLTQQRPGGKVCVANVPPEEFLISKEARSIEGARYVGHRKKVMISELAKEGVKEDVLDRLSGDDGASQTDSEAVKRNTVENPSIGSGSEIDHATKMVWRTESYIKIDVDGDGIAEMRQVISVGPENEIIENNSWDSPRPFATLTPIIMPHRFWGLAVADVIKDIQLIKSTILRQYLDNLYLSNNQREEVIEANIVDPSEVLSSKPGMKIRVKNGQSIFPVVVPQIGAQALEGLNYIDQIRENRTGVSARTQGLGADDLHETATGERMLMSAAMGKIELIARVFAETGVKDAFRLILKLVCMYQDKARVVRLTNGWVQMDPNQWNSDMDMKASVGMGMGDRDQQLAHAQLLGNAQGQAAQLGFVSPENFKNTAEILVNALGLKGVERFFSFPQGPQGQQPVKIPPKGAGHQVDPNVQMAMKQADVQGRVQAATAVATINAKAKAAADSNLNQLEAQREALQHQDEMQMEHVKAALQVIVAHINNVGKIAAAEAMAKVDVSATLAREEAAEETGQAA